MAAAMTSPQYALVAYVKGAVADFVSQIRRELHPPQAHLPAHLSILPPRPLHGSEGDALELAEGICSTTMPFEAMLGDVESFFPITPTVFIRVAYAAYRLRELHDLMNTGAFAAEEQWPYMPHLTLFRMQDIAAAESALTVATRRWSDYRDSRRLLIDQLTFVRQAGPDQWIDLAPIPLGHRLAPAGAAH